MTKKKKKKQLKIIKKIIKARKKIILKSEKELIIKTSKLWSKRAYVNKKAYEKKYNLSIKNNESFWTR